MKNLEIKAKFENTKNLKRIFKDIGATLTETMSQVDTYFNVPKGRLKLREIGKGKAYVIYYERGEKTTERWSNFYTYDVTNPKEFKQFFSKSLDVKVTVDKKRILYMYKNARIHVDLVKDLGNFIEIEVEVKKGDAQAEKLMKELLSYLKIPKADFIKKSYSDLILNGNKS